MHQQARTLVVALLGAAVAALACGGSSPVAPSPMPGFDANAPSPSPATLSPLPIGETVGGEVPCPSGSPQGPTCTMISVTCPGVPPAPALLRIERPVAAARGTILLTTDNDGLMFARSNAVSPLAPSMIARFVADGVTVVEVAWRPGMWGGPRARALACRFATLARWVFQNVHRGGLFAAQGTGAGASQIAFGLAHYGLGDYLGLANLGGGPLACPLCSADASTLLEPLLPAPPPASSREPTLSYPSSTVRFFLGDSEPNPTVRADAEAYYASIRSDKSLTIVPGTAHTIEQTQAGVDAFVASVRSQLR